MSLPPARYDTLDDITAPEAAESGNVVLSNGASSAATLTVAKIARFRGLSVYFCRDEQYYR